MARFLSPWSLPVCSESIKAFAGTKFENAVHYAEDKKLLLSLNLHVSQ
jgi:hypothetical protein